MKIAFCSIHPYWGGIQNNGGSLTVLKSAAMLRELGHEVTVVSHTDNCSWFRHSDCERVIPKDTEVCVAVSVSDIRPMLKEAPRKAKKCWWMRGIEKWQIPEKEIRHLAKKVPVVCNAQHLVDWLGHGTLCYFGLDLDFWKDAKRQRKHIGGLVNARHKTKNSDMVDELCNLKAKGKLDQAGMRNLYNECAVWVATSILEGFHRAPAEAALCGCVAVGIDAPHNGTGDWLDDTTGHLFKTLEEAREAINNPDVSRVENAQRVIREKIGGIRTNMKKFTKILEGL